jgi:hypothetical protein
MDKLPASHDVVVRKYTYVPGLAHSALESHGTLHGNGGWTGPQVTQPLLHEFLALLEAAQEELNQRWDAQEKPGCHADRV